jgi:hypothetical protein
MLVVDPFERIEVDERDEAGAAVEAAAPRLVQLGREGPAVRHARQRVGRREATEVVDDALQVGAQTLVLQLAGQQSADRGAVAHHQRRTREGADVEGDRRGQGGVGRVELDVVADRRAHPGGEDVAERGLERRLDAGLEAEGALSAGGDHTKHCTLAVQVAHSDGAVGQLALQRGHDELDHLGGGPGRRDEGGIRCGAGGTTPGLDRHCVQLSLTRRQETGADSCRLARTPPCSSSKRPGAMSRNASTSCGSK